MSCQGEGDCKSLNADGEEDGAQGLQQHNLMPSFISSPLLSSPTTIPSPPPFSWHPFLLEPLFLLSTPLRSLPFLPSPPLLLSPPLLPFSIPSSTSPTDEGSDAEELGPGEDEDGEDRKTTALATDLKFATEVRERWQHGRRLILVPFRFLRTRRTWTEGIFSRQVGAFFLRPLPLPLLASSSSPVTSPATPPVLSLSTSRSTR
eukprot:763329-Hanusia_phi.AAC.8